MTTIEFECAAGPAGQIAMPSDLASAIPQGTSLKVSIRWGADDEDEHWTVSSMRRFEAAYAPEDDIYEQLIDAIAIR